MNCCAEGCCKIPFYVYEPADLDNKKGSIVKLFGGAAEVFTGAHNLDLFFPPNADANTRVNLLGALGLINMVYFQQQAEK